MQIVKDRKGDCLIDKLGFFKIKAWLIVTNLKLYFWFSLLLKPKPITWEMIYK